MKIASMSANTDLPVSRAQAAINTAAAYAQQALSPATLRAYKADWAHFEHWCHQAQLAPLPAQPQTVAAYLASLAGHRTRATIQRRVVSIGQVHKLADLEWRPAHPAIRNTLRGVFRQHGRPAVKAAALGRDEVIQLIRACGTGSLSAIRDRALLLLGFAGALRRAELVAIRFEHLTFNAEGVRLLLPRSKGDQDGEGVEIGIARGRSSETCPVTALRRWLDASGCDEGPVFRRIRAEGTICDTALHPSSIRLILLRRANEAKLRVGQTERLSPHGLRAGFVTDAYKAGARDEEIMSHTRHKDFRTMKGYVRRAKLVTESVSGRVGL